MANTYTRSIEYASNAVVCVVGLFVCMVTMISSMILLGAYVMGIILCIAALIVLVCITGLILLLVGVKMLAHRMASLARGMASLARRVVLLMNDICIAVCCGEFAIHYVYPIVVKYWAGLVILFGSLLCVGMVYMALQYRRDNARRSAVCVCHKWTKDALSAIEVSDVKNIQHLTGVYVTTMKKHVCSESE